MENVKTITLNINCGIENESDQTIAETFKLLISTLKGETVLVNDLKVLDFSSRINLKEIKKNTSTEIDFDRLIAYFNKVFKKQARIISEQAKIKFRKRLKEGYTKDDIQKVIDNCSNDNHHKDNDYKYVTFDFLSRPEIFERYAAMEHKKPISNKGHNNH
ncbi:MAG: conserved phage C-terminal domain-containing protein [Flavobacterium sp.]|jgi:uncharacterized phage protein (TIGR02220 family)|nr:conserved phage C-terminal domain-containing protein [Flavobacterium sp.]